MKPISLVTGSPIFHLMHFLPLDLQLMPFRIEVMAPFQTVNYAANTAVYLHGF